MGKLIILQCAQLNIAILCAFGIPEVQKTLDFDGIYYFSMKTLYVATNN